MDSILATIKQTLGIPEESKHFDPDLMMHINTILAMLSQMGIGDEKGFSIRGEDAVWTDIIPDSLLLGLVKSYVHLKVRLVFDPPTSSAVMEAMQRMTSEFEWRMQVELMSPSKHEEGENQNV